MSIAPCPKCSTNLKVPDGSVAAVRCPKCQTVFQPASVAKPAFEVIDDPQPPPVRQPPAVSRQAPSRPAAVPPPAKPAPAPRPKPAAKPAPAEPEFEVVDDAPAARKKGSARPADDDDDDRPRRRNRDDDEDDRPRGRTRRDDDEDEDRPGRRSSRSEDDDDDVPPRRRTRDDDEDDRPRGRRSREDDEDDRRGRKGRRRHEDDDYDQGRRSGGYGPAKVGALLLSISLWIYLGVFGLLALFVLIGWVGGDLPGVLMALAGIVGLSNWLVAAVGLGFCIAGPKKCKGITIATTVVSGVHLLLVLIMFGRSIDTSSGSSQNMQGPGVYGVGRSSIAWLLLTTLTQVLEVFPAALVYASRELDSKEVLITILTALCEVARLILVLLTLKSLANAARDGDAAGKAMFGLKSILAVCGGATGVILVFVVIVVEAKLTRFYNLGMAVALLVMLAHTCMLIMPGLAANETKNALARRARRR